MSLLDELDDEDDDGVDEEPDDEPHRQYELVLCIETDDFTSPRGRTLGNRPRSFNVLGVVEGCVYAVPVGSYVREDLVLIPFEFLSSRWMRVVARFRAVQRRFYPGVPAWDREEGSSGMPPSEKCPDCGGPAMAGYGFAFGGGLGTYTFCPRPKWGGGCGWFVKVPDVVGNDDVVDPGANPQPVRNSKPATPAPNPSPLSKLLGRVFGRRS